MIEQNASSAVNEIALGVLQESNRRDTLKQHFPAILESCLGIVTTACKKAGVSRDWYYDNIKADPEFAKKCAEVQEVAIDFAESHLFEQIKDNIPSSTMFFLKTRAKHRGYIERIETTGADGEPIRTIIEVKPYTKEQIDRALEVVNDTTTDDK